METKGRAPHKPLLLLSIIEMIDTGQLTANRIEPTTELMTTLSLYSDLVPQGRFLQLCLPFHHLQSEPFHLRNEVGWEPYWKLYDQEGGLLSIELGQPKTTTKLRERVGHAEFSEEIWEMLQVPENRKSAREVLIEKHFDESVWNLLREQVNTNIETVRLLDFIKPKEGAPPDTPKPVRDQLFRRRIQEAYDHTCAFTGLRLRTPLHHTAIDAAHIRPWSEYNDDRVQNGIALSKLCHWAFDRGLLTVNDDYEILVSSHVKRQGQRRVGNLLDLDGERLAKLPEDVILRPDLQCLQWHRTKRFNKW